MDAADFVRIEIEQLTAEMALEVKVALRASAIEVRAMGSNLTWGASGVRVVVPSAALKTLQEALTRTICEAEPASP